jgi:hypothetical protein
MGWIPYANLIGDFEVQFSSPTTTNTDKCFPPIIQKWNNQYEKEEYEEGGREGVGADFVLEQTFYKACATFSKGNCWIF